MESNTNGYKKRGPKASGLIKDIKRRTQKTYNAEEKIRIVLEGLRGEDTITNICRKDGIHDSL